MNNKTYYGKYFGIDYVKMAFLPTEEFTKELIKYFPLKYTVGSSVIFRRPHKKTESGIITRAFYGTAANFPRYRADGGTIKGYLIQVGKYQKFVHEQEIKN